jgi:23S rRNA pseudouridine1911/1915/1917 synthase
MEIEIVHENALYVVVNKPAGMLAHPTRPDDTVLTLWDHLRRALAPDLVEAGRQISIVNRLDRDTSGLVLVALSARVARGFGLAMQNRLISKEYLALTRGWPAADAWVEEAALDAQRRHEPFRVQLKQIAHPAGYPARTEFSVERRFLRGGERFSLVRARPRTGRMHQIRVHLALAGTPVLGDKLYGPPPGEELYLRLIETGWTPELEARLLVRHHALHSAAMAWPEIALGREDEPGEVIPAARYFTGPPTSWDDWLGQAYSGKR